MFFFLVSVKVSHFTNKENIPSAGSGLGRGHQVQILPDGEAHLSKPIFWKTATKTWHKMAPCLPLSLWTSLLSIDDLEIVAQSSSIKYGTKVEAELGVLRREIEPESLLREIYKNPLIWL